MDLEWEHRVRSKVFEWLSTVSLQHPDGIPGRLLQSGIEVDGERIRVMASGPGICKPAQLDAAISVMTAAPKPGQPPPYEDRWIDESRLSYAYEGEDPNFWRNQSLRTAMEHQLPLVYLYGLMKSRYLAEFPVYVAGDDPTSLRVDLVIGAGLGESGVGVELDGRRYTTRASKTRLHQYGFRVRVLSAYENRCSMCALRHSSLLDAAHIVPDGEATGLAITANGLSLCKIHHAAYDQYFIGVRPDLVVEVNKDLLNEKDGPMLQYGLQALHNEPLRVRPSRKVDKPDPIRLEWRYQRFTTAGG